MLCLTRRRGVLRLRARADARPARHVARAAAADDVVLRRGVAGRRALEPRRGAVRELRHRAALPRCGCSRCSIMPAARDAAAARRCGRARTCSGCCSNTWPHGPARTVYLPEAGIGALVLAMLGAIWMLAPRGVPARALGSLLFLPLLLPSREPIGAARSKRSSSTSARASRSSCARAITRCCTTPARAIRPNSISARPPCCRRCTRSASRRSTGSSSATATTITPAARRPSRASFPTPIASAASPYRGDLAMRQCVAGETWHWDGVQFPRDLADRRRDRHAAIRAPTTIARACCSSKARAAGCCCPATSRARIEPRVADRRCRPSDAARARALPHHGSRTSSSAAFIAALQPALAIVSAGWRSRYGHPHPEVVARFADARRPTAQHGRPRRADGRISGDAEPRRDRRARAPPPLLARTDRPAVLSTGQRVAEWRRATLL